VQEWQAHRSQSKADEGQEVEISAIVSAIRIGTLMVRGPRFAVEVKVLHGLGPILLAAVSQ
jgi:hypothetical protein